MFLPTEIFSKRRKICTRVEEKPELLDSGLLPDYFYARSAAVERPVIAQDRTNCHSELFHLGYKQFHECAALLNDIFCTLSLLTPGCTL